MRHHLKPTRGVCHHGHVLPDLHGGRRHLANHAGWCRRRRLGLLRAHRHDGTRLRQATVQHVLKSGFGFLIVRPVLLLLLLLLLLLGKHGRWGSGLDKTLRRRLLERNLRRGRESALLHLR